MKRRRKESVMKYKLAYTGLIFLIYILGKNIPLYGVDLSVYSDKSAGAEDVLMQMISGGANNYSIFALGIYPFMISGILVQVAFAIRNLFSKTKVSPKVMGYASVTVTLIIAVLQTIVQVSELEFAVAEEMIDRTRVIAGLEMITGTMVILWLAGRNKRYGVGGPMSFGLVNILERNAMILLSYNMKNLVQPLLISMFMMVVTLVMENAEMRIPLQRVSIHNIYADKNYMAIKLNPIGVMPVMFTSAVFMLPQLLVALLSFFFPRYTGVAWWLENMSLTKSFGIFIYVVCEYLLTIGLSMIMINPKDITQQFLKSGDSIVNLHAGRDTRRYLRRTLWNISFFSATIMGIFVAVPLMLQMKGKVDGTLAMLPISIMMMTSFWCNIFRELVSIHKYDSCQPLF